MMTEAGALVGMARLGRVIAVGIPHHVSPRGNAGGSSSPSRPSGR
jgi:hypothetical protein